MLYSKITHGTFLGGCVRGSDGGDDGSWLAEVDLYQQQIDYFFLAEWRDNQQNDPEWNKMPFFS